MIEAGRYFCPYCRRVNSEAFYKSKDLTCVRLRHGRSAVGKKKYYVEPCVEESNKETNNLPRVELVEGDDLFSDWNGIPNEVHVRVGNNSNVDLFSLACPYCGKHLPLSDYGWYPTYLVPLVGYANVGKTTWLHALAANLQIFNNINPDYHIQMMPVPAYREKQVTPAKSIGESAYIEVQKKNSSNLFVTFAGVFLIDIPAEQWAKPEEYYLSYLLNPTRTDGIIFMEPAYYDKELQANKKAEIENMLKRFLPLRQRVPVAYVRTKLDVLLEKYPESSRMMPNQNQNIQILTEDTFSRVTYYDTQHLIHRIAKENFISNKLPGIFTYAMGTDMDMGFMVQSCDPGDDADDDDTSCHKNLFDPLLWLMNRLQIFPL